MEWLICTSFAPGQPALTAGAEAENPAGLVSLPGGAQHHHDDHENHGPSLAAVRAFQRELQATRQTELLVCMSVNECACACACAFPLAYAALKHALQLARVDYMHVSTLAGTGSRDEAAGVHRAHSRDYEIPG